METTCCGREESYVALAQLADCWYVAEVEGTQIKFVAADKERKAAKIGAQVFSRLNDVPYRQETLTFSMPPVTVWRESNFTIDGEMVDFWVSVFVFPDHVQICGYATPEKEQHLKIAQNIASESGRSFHPEIGELFPGKANSVEVGA